MSEDGRFDTRFAVNCNPERRNGLHFPGLHFPERTMEKEGKKEGKGPKKNLLTDIELKILKTQEEEKRNREENS